MSKLDIEISGLRKSYGGVHALDGLSMSVPSGAIAGFVGLNGAGKTTTLRLLLQMARPDAGTASLLGLNALHAGESLQIRARTAFVPEKKDFFPYMNVGEVIDFTKGLYPKWRADLETRYLTEFGLKRPQAVTQLSKGALAKLHLLMAFSRGAELILLDEPTDGLDPLGVDIFMQALVGLVAESGATVLFSSHRLNEMEQVADHICMIHQGRSLMNGGLDDLKASCRRVVLLFQNDAALVAGEFKAFGTVKPDGRTLTVFANGTAEAVVKKGGALGAKSVDVQPVSLREMFLELVQRNV